MSAAPNDTSPPTTFPLEGRPPENGTYGVLPVERLRELAGIDLFRGIISGELPGAPIAKVMNMWIQEAEPGRVVFGGRPEQQHYNPIGSVHGGFAGTMLDSAMSCAVQSMLPRGQGYTTLEYKVSLLRPITDRIGAVYAEGKVIQVGGRVGTAEGRIVDAAGKLYATGTTTCLIFPI